MMCSVDSSPAVNMRILRIMEYRSEFVDPIYAPGVVQHDVTMNFTQREFILTLNPETDTFIHKSFQPDNSLYDSENNAALFVANHFDNRQLELKTVDMNDIRRNQHSQFVEEESSLNNQIATLAQNHTDNYWKRRRFHISMHDKCSRRHAIIFAFMVVYNASDKTFHLQTNDSDWKHLSDFARRKILHMVRVYFDQPQSGFVDA